MKTGRIMRIVLDADTTRRINALEKKTGLKRTALYQAIVAEGVKKIENDTPGDMFETLAKILRP